MREQIASAHDVPQPEVARQSAQTLGRLFAVPAVTRLRGELDDEVVVGVASKATEIGESATCLPIAHSCHPPREPITRNLILEIHIAHGRPDVVRVQPLLGRDVLEADLHTVLDVLQGQDAPVVPRRPRVGRRVDDAPDIVLIAMRIESDLLLCAAR